MSDPVDVAFDIMKRYLEEKKHIIYGLIYDAIEREFGEWLKDIPDWEKEFESDIDDIYMTVYYMIEDYIMDEVQYGRGREALELAVNEDGTINETVLRDLIDGLFKEIVHKYVDDVFRNRKYDLGEKIFPEEEEEFWDDEEW